MDERFAKNKEEKVVSNKASLDKNTIKKNYAFLALMIGGMVLLDMPSNRWELYLSI